MCVLVLRFALQQSCYNLNITNTLFSPGFSFPFFVRVLSLTTFTFLLMQMAKLYSNIIGISQCSTLSSTVRDLSVRQLYILRYCPYIIRIIQILYCIYITYLYFITLIKNSWKQLEVAFVIWQISSISVYCIGVWPIKVQIMPSQKKSAWSCYWDLTFVNDVCSGLKRCKY